MSDEPAAVPGTTPDRAQIVLATAAVAIAAHVAFRAWASYPSWFFTDDYRLMADAQGQQLTLAHLLTPFDSQFMPFGRLLVWLTVHSGTTNWLLAASIVLVLQLAAAVACLWMLVTLFGPRPAVLPLLAVYLTSAVALPGYLWWAAALNQLPLQVVFFVAVTTWVRHLRDEGRRWLPLTFLVLGIGLLAYVKALLLVPVLGYLLLAHFSSGPPRARLLGALRRQWVATAVAVAGSAAFTAFYVSSVTQPFTAGDDRARLAGEVADSMLGTALPTGLLGGPWVWFRTNPPTVLAQPPDWSVHLSWVLLAAVIAQTVLRRHRSGRAWVLLGGYSLVAYALLASSRGQLFGTFAGLEYRYLTDVLPVAILCTGLALLDLPGAAEGSVRRAEPRLRLRSRWVAVLAGVVCLGGVVSSWQYVGYWHDENAGRSWVMNLQDDLRSSGPTDLPSQLLPPEVMPEYTQPLNRTENFIPLVSSQARFPRASENLRVLNDEGNLVPAGLEGGTASLPGPVPGCGWRLEQGALDIPMQAELFDYTWWLRIGYLGSQDGTVVVRAGTDSTEVDVRRGLHTVFVRLEAEFSSVTVSTMDAGTLCIDAVDAGNPVAGGR